MPTLKILYLNTKSGNSWQLTATASAAHEPMKCKTNVWKLWSLFQDQWGFFQNVCAFIVLLDEHWAMPQIVRLLLVVPTYNAHHRQLNRLCFCCSDRLRSDSQHMTIDNWCQSLPMILSRAINMTWNVDILILFDYYHKSCGGDKWPSLQCIECRLSKEANLSLFSSYDYGADDYGGFFGGGFPSLFGAPR